MRSIAALVAEIESDPRAGEALARLVRDRGDYAVAEAAASALLRLGSPEALTIFARAYEDADEQYRDHYNGELREAIQEAPGLLDRLGELAATERGAKEAVDWMTASPWQPEPEPGWFERFKLWWVEQVQGRELLTVGVTDAEYLALFDRLVDGDLGHHAFAREFFNLYADDQRIRDRERYEILQRVFYGCEDLAMDGTEPDRDEITPARLTEIVTKAAHDLRHRRYDWEGRHAGGS